MFWRKKKKSSSSQEEQLHQILSEQHLERKRCMMRQHLEKKVRSGRIQSELHRHREEIAPLLEHLFSPQELHLFWNTPLKKQQKICKQLEKEDRITAQEALLLKNCLQMLDYLPQLELEMIRNGFPEPYHLLLEQMVSMRQTASMLVSCFSQVSDKLYALIHTLLHHYLSHDGNLLTHCPRDLITKSAVQDALKKAPHHLLENSALELFCTHSMPLIRMQMVHAIDLWLYDFRQGKEPLPELHIQIDQEEGLLCVKKLQTLEKILDPIALRLYITEHVSL